MNWMKDDKELSKHMADVQKRASEIELDSELQRQKKSKPPGVSLKLLRVLYGCVLVLTSNQLA